MSVRVPIDSAGTSRKRLGDLRRVVGEGAFSRVENVSCKAHLRSRHVDVMMHGQYDKVYPNRPYLRVYADVDRVDVAEGALPWGIVGGDFSKDGVDCIVDAEISDQLFADFVLEKGFGHAGFTVPSELSMDFDFCVDARFDFDVVRMPDGTPSVWATFSKSASFMHFSNETFLGAQNLLDVFPDYEHADVPVLEDPFGKESDLSDEDVWDVWRDDTVYGIPVEVEPVPEEAVSEDFVREAEPDSYGDDMEARAHKAYADGVAYVHDRGAELYSAHEQPVPEDVSRAMEKLVSDGDMGIDAIDRAIKELFGEPVVDKEPSADVSRELGMFNFTFQEDASDALADERHASGSFSPVNRDADAADFLAGFEGDGVSVTRGEDGAVVVDVDSDSASVSVDGHDWLDAMLDTTSDGVTDDASASVEEQEDETDEFQVAADFLAEFEDDGADDSPVSVKEQEAEADEFQHREDALDAQRAAHRDETVADDHIDDTPVSVKEQEAEADEFQHREDALDAQRSVQRDESVFEAAINDVGNKVDEHVLLRRKALLSLPLVEDDDELGLHGGIGV
jgi:hypothetical protein